MSNVLAPILVPQFPSNCEQLVLNFEGFNWTEIEGVLYLSSKDLSIKTGKQHFHILEKVRKYLSKLGVEFSSTGDIIESSMIPAKFGVIRVYESEVKKEGAREGFESHYLLNQTATLALMSSYDLELQVEVCDFFIRAHQHYLTHRDVQIKKLEAEVKKRTRQPAGTSKNVNVIRKVEVLEKGEVVGHVWKGMIELRENSTHAERLKYQAMMAIRKFQRMAERLEDAGINYIPPIHLKNGNIVNPSCLNMLLSGKTESDNDEYMGYYEPSTEEEESL